MKRMWSSSSKIFKVISDQLQIELVVERWPIKVASSKVWDIGHIQLPAKHGTSGAKFESFFQALWNYVEDCSHE